MKTRVVTGELFPIRFLKARQVAKILGYDSTSSVLRFLKRTGLPLVMVNARHFVVEEGPLMQWIQEQRVAYRPAVRRRGQHKVINLSEHRRATA